MRPLLFFMVLALAGMGSPSRALADLMLEFDSSPYQVNPGGMVDVSVYLQQTAGGVQITDANGLGIAGIRVSFDVPPTPSDPAMVASVSDVVGNPQFDAATPDLSPGHYADLALLSLAGVNVDANGRLLLGTFTFTAGSTPGQVTNISVAAIPDGSSFATVNGDLLSPTGASTTITVPVPEPSSVVMLSLSTTLALLVKSKRSRAGFAPRPSSV